MSRFILASVIFSSLFSLATQAGENPDVQNQQPIASIKLSSDKLLLAGGANCSYSRTESQTYTCSHGTTKSSSCDIFTDMQGNVCMKRCTPQTCKQDE
jgi:hypothetical protein